MAEPGGPLIERDVELSALAAAAEAVAGGEGRLVVIEGPAGIGKTRLLRSVRESALAGELRVLQARATELENHIAFGVVRQLLDPVVLGIPEKEREERFTGAAALALSVFGAGELGQDSAGADRYSKINGLFWLVSTIAREQSLALVVDDFQWADEPSLEFLSFLASRVEALPLLVVAATRPASESSDALVGTLVTQPSATVLRPAPLSGASVETLVRETVGSDADEDFAAACLEATRGNPFLLAELLREVTARRIAPTAEAARRVGALAPGGVSAAIELRLRQMPEGARPLAEAIAVVGEGASAATAARLLDLDPAAAGDAEAALVRAEVLEDRNGLCFTHPLVRATVLHGMSPGHRARLHGLAAELLSERGAAPEDLATHLLHLEPAGDSERVEQLRAAAVRATQLGAPATAVSYLGRALAEPPSGDLRCVVLTELGVAEARSGAGEATDHLRQAVSEATNPTSHALASLELARALKFGGHAVHAVDVLEALDGDLASLPADLRELVELELIGLAYISAGARERLSARIAQLADPRGAPTSQLEAFTLAGLAFDAAAGASRPAGEAAELAARAVASDLIPADPMEGGYGMLICGVSMMFCDRLEEAARIHGRMLAEGRRRGSVVARSAAASVATLVNWRRGRIADADAECSLALELAEGAHGTEALLNASRATSALIALARGADEEELERIESEVLDASTDPDALPYHLVLHARGLVRIERGEVEAGIEDLLECGRVSVGWACHNPSVVPWRSDAAIALARAGERDRAEELAAEELEIAERFGAKRPIGIALRAVALVANDDSSLPTLERAVATLSDSEGMLELAKAMTDLAAAQRRAGERGAARESAARGQELATACGATALARLAQEEALAAGARPRRVALRGVDSLTPSELRVAHRAAEGLTNREIAEDLYVTVKTVEMHLANAYGKLDIRSRTQLPDALATGAEPVGAKA
jgi:DNA-binding CsgD family transcriptional regulator